MKSTKHGPVLSAGATRQQGFPSLTAIQERHHVDQSLEELADWQTSRLPRMLVSRAATEVRAPSHWEGVCQDVKRFSRLPAPALCSVR